MTRCVPCEVYSRIVGYLRPVDAWNAAKQQEFEDRVTYNWQAGGESDALSGEAQEPRPKR